jgi:hypothetical protein
METAQSRSQMTVLDAEFMTDADQTRRSYADIIYALVSIACPFIALALISIYQAYAYQWFWQLTNQPKRLDDADVNAAAIMGFIIVIELILAAMVGCAIGLGFAALSLWKRRHVVSFGTAALLFNTIPLFLFIWRFLAGPF